MEIINALILPSNIYKNCVIITVIVVTCSSWIYKHFFLYSFAILVSSASAVWSALYLYFTFPWIHM